MVYVILYVEFACGLELWVCICRHMLLLGQWIRIMQIFYWCCCAFVRLVTTHSLSKIIILTLLEKFLLKWLRDYLGICWLIYWIAWKLPSPSVVYAMWVFLKWDTLFFSPVSCNFGMQLVRACWCNSHMKHSLNVVIIDMVCTSLLPRAYK